MHVDGSYFIFTKYFSESKLIRGNIFRKCTSKNLGTVPGQQFFMSKIQPKNHESGS